MPIANPAAIKASGGDYTTIQAWEDALVNNEGILVGECYGEVYAAVGFGGVAFNATNYPYLRPVAGQEHDGRAHEVSAKGNARIESTVATTVIGISYVDYVRIGWLEIKGPGSGNNRAINGTGSYNYFHHLIIHDNDAGAAGAYRSIAEYGAGPQFFYRNIVYGYGGVGAYLYASSANSVCLCNTFYKNNLDNSVGNGGILTGSTNFLIENNACFDNLQADIYGTAGTLDYNATSDTTGDDEGANGIANLTTANQFVNPTATWTATDLLHKAGHGMTPGTTFDPATYPEINVPIQNGASRTIVSGTWDIGAGQYVAAGGAVFPYWYYELLRKRQ